MDPLWWIEQTQGRRKKGQRLFSFNKLLLWWRVRRFYFFVGYITVPVLFGMMGLCAPVVIAVAGGVGGECAARLFSCCCALIEPNRASNQRTQGHYGNKGTCRMSCSKSFIRDLEPFKGIQNHHLDRASHSTLNHDAFNTELKCCCLFYAPSSISRTLQM